MLNTKVMVPDGSWRGLHSAAVRQHLGAWLAPGTPAPRCRSAARVGAAVWFPHAPPKFPQRDPRTFLQTWSVPTTGRARHHLELGGCLIQGSSNPKYWLLNVLVQNQRDHERQGCLSLDPRASSSSGTPERKERS